MTTITVEVPDSLAAEIEPMREELPMLLSITRELFRPAGGAHTSPVYVAYKQMIDFLAASPSPEQVAQFTLSPPAQEHIHKLLQRNGEGQLNESEVAELRVYAQISQVMGLKKAQATLALASRNC